MKGEVKTMELTEKELEIIARRRVEKPYTKRMGIALGVMLAATWALIPFEGLGEWRIVGLLIMAAAYMVYAGWQLRLLEKQTRIEKGAMMNELSIEGITKGEKQAAPAR
jgi:hypothetical protein